MKPLSERESTELTMAEVQVYVIHVASAVARARHIQAQLDRHGLAAEFVLEGDVAALTQADMERWFREPMNQINPGTSCVFKHLMACRRLLETDRSWALVFEDDIRLRASFGAVMAKALDELKQVEPGCLVSLEDSNLRYVPRSQRQPGRTVYPHFKGRLAGAYLIDRTAAQNLVARATTEKLSEPMDWFHNRCAREGDFKVYWLHPPVAVQGSLDGSIGSTLDDKPSGWTRIVAFHAERVYKRLLYWFR